MNDDLISEINLVLESDKESSSKLKSYFPDGNEDDDIFDSLIDDENDAKKGINSTNKVGNSVGEEKLKFKSMSIKNEDNVGQTWLISESTKTILAQIVSKEVLPENVKNTILAKPQLHTEPKKRLDDPIFSILEEHYDYNTAAELRSIPVINENSFSEQDLIKLLKNGWIRPAIDVITVFLKNSGFVHSTESCSDSSNRLVTFTPYISKMWSLRFSLMIRIRLYNILDMELSGFLNMDCPNLYGEFYENEIAGSKGSLVPFSLRLIHAEAPLYMNKSVESLNRLYYLLAVIKRIIANIRSGFSEDGTKNLLDETIKAKSLTLWHKRQLKVFLSIVKVFIVMKDYTAALDILYDLVSKEKSSQTTATSLPRLYQIIGKICLMIGDVSNGINNFKESFTLINGSEIKKNFLNNLYNGFIQLSKHNVEEAKDLFYRCLQANKSSLTAINNYAVCCLYMKEVAEAISTLEGAIQEGNFNHTLILNLCILYELQTTQLKSKKMRIVKTLAGFLGDDCIIGSFKIAMNE